jgi:hypothetical protein
MRYQRPTIETIDAPAIIEAMGPAQGYDGGITTPSGYVDPEARLTGNNS